MFWENPVLKKLAGSGLAMSFVTQLIFVNRTTCIDEGLATSRLPRVDGSFDSGVDNGAGPRFWIY